MQKPGHIQMYAFNTSKKWIVYLDYWHFLKFCLCGVILGFCEETTTRFV